MCPAPVCPWKMIINLDLPSRYSDHRLWATILIIGYVLYKKLDSLADVFVCQLVTATETSYLKLL